MIKIPDHLVGRYQAYCRGCGINDLDLADYLKWLRFFLDFCEKYQISGDIDTRIKRFLDKLQGKKQGEDQRQRARHAVSLYFKMLQKNISSAVPALAVPYSQLQQVLAPDAEKPEPSSVSTARQSQYSEAGYQEKSDSLEWDKVLEVMATEIKVRHYSRKTLQTYAKWSRNFQHFLKSKPPGALSTEDVKEYLGFLAVK